MDSPFGTIFIYLLTKLFPKYFLKQRAEPDELLANPVDPEHRRWSDREATSRRAQRRTRASRTCTAASGPCSPCSSD
jgi:hypothetical protein